MRTALSERALSMAAAASRLSGVELLHPMLDGELVRLLTSWPGRSKIKRRSGLWWEKWPAKQSLLGRLPQQLVWRQKRQLPTGLKLWTGSSGRSFLEDSLQKLEALGDHLRLDSIREMRDEHQQGNQQRTTLLGPLSPGTPWTTGLDVCRS